MKTICDGWEERNKKSGSKLIITSSSFPMQILTVFYSIFMS